MTKSLYHNFTHKFPQNLVSQGFGFTILAAATLAMVALSDSIIYAM